MLYKADALSGYKLHSLDGDIGDARDFYFDDHHWTIRYLIVNTGNWLVGRQVLLSPYSVSSIDKEKKVIGINLTKKQIEESPDLDTDKPVSRQFEESYYGYYGWPMYWGGPYMWGPYSFLPSERTNWKNKTEIEKGWDSHLRSAKSVEGYNIAATDGDIGHVEDFIVDDKTWAIRYMVVDTKNWWPGKKVLVAPQWIKSVSWSESRVFVDLSREAIKQSLEYTDKSILTRDYETKLHQNYQRHGYWENESENAKHSA